MRIFEIKFPLRFNGFSMDSSEKCVTIATIYIYNNFATAGSYFIVYIQINHGLEKCEVIVKLWKRREVSAVSGGYTVLLNNDKVAMNVKVTRTCYVL